MSGRRSPFQFVLSEGDRDALEAIVAKRTSPQRMVMRARIVLLAAEGWTNVDIAEELDIVLNTVIKWRKRFFEEGVAGLSERKRSGRPKVFSPLSGGPPEGPGL